MLFPYPTDEAAPFLETVQFLTDRFGLPAYETNMQDWPLDVSDGSRLAEFGDAYEAGMPTEAAQAALMELLLYSLEEVFPYASYGPPTPLVQKEAARIAVWLDQDFVRYFGIINYWRCGTDPDPEHGLSITPLIRRVWHERFDKPMEEHFPCFARFLQNENAGIEAVLPPLSPDEINALEQNLGTPLSASYKTFLGICGGFRADKPMMNLNKNTLFVMNFPARSGKQKNWPPPAQGMLCFADYFLESDGDQVLLIRKMALLIRSTRFIIIITRRETCGKWRVVLVHGWKRWTLAPVRTTRTNKQAMSKPRITVLIPTYQRPDNLLRGLESLKKQTRPADQIVVSVRVADTLTRDFLANYEAAPLPLCVADVTEGGVIAAMNAGLHVASGDIIVLTDDDTAPYPDWIERIEAHFDADATIGGVGGRDFQAHNPGPLKENVGMVSYFGRITGNHHLGAGPPRLVDSLKGANCAYRAAPLKEIGFDTRLLGKGAQVNWELGLGFAFRRAGWKLLYDPAVCLEHHESVRHDNDQMHRTGQYDYEVHFNAVHNETIFLWEHLSLPRRAAFLAWAFAVGTRGEPGAALAALHLLQRNTQYLRRFPSHYAARIAGIRTAQKTAARPTVSPPQNGSDRAENRVQLPSDTSDNTSDNINDNINDNGNKTA